MGTNNILALWGFMGTNNILDLAINPHKSPFGFMENYKSPSPINPTSPVNIGRRKKRTMKEQCDEILKQYDFLGRTDFSFPLKSEHPV